MYDTDDWLYIFVELWTRCLLVYFHPEMALRGWLGVNYQETVPSYPSLSCPLRFQSSLSGTLASITLSAETIDLYSLWLILPTLLRSSAGRRKFFMSKLPACLFALVSLSSVRSVLHHSYLLIDHDCLCGDVAAIAPSSFPASDSAESNME